MLEFVEATDGWLRLFFLPPYSPELNPDELVWNHLKNHGVGKRIVHSRDDFKARVIGHLRSLQAMPEKFRGLFRQPDVRCPADAC